MAKRGGFPGGMPGNMTNLMKQAQRMQRQMEETTKELEEKEYTASAGGRSRYGYSFREKGSALCEALSGGCGSGRYRDA